MRKQNVQKYMAKRMIQGVDQAKRRIQGVDQIEMQASFLDVQVGEGMQPEMIVEKQVKMIHLAQMEQIGYCDQGQKMKKKEEQQQEEEEQGEVGVVVVVQKEDIKWYYWKHCVAGGTLYESTYSRCCTVQGDGFVENE